ncbi:MAG: cobyrinate a,c-diamide synthase [Mogibacterium sp.]|nr:cobyrinate a,c-diamide synthase [Mogibacterium sp.]
MTGRILIAAPKSGSGKTILTCGLLKLIKDSGSAVMSYKCGPDYIDPMFHRKVIGIPGSNLDSFFSDAEKIRRIVAEHISEGYDAAVIEGVMGIYDGIAGASGKGSCYDIARITGTPVVLVIDVKGMGPTMLSVIKGILSDDTSHLIHGIVLNRITPHYYKEISPLMKEMLDEISAQRGISVSLLGGIPHSDEIRLSSRHLGLIMPDEIDDLKEQVDTSARLLSDHMDLGLLEDIMGQAEVLQDDWICNDIQDNKKYDDQTVTIVTARDEAFCFYYEENLRMLEKYGIKVVEFSPLHDEALPADADGILLGGGYPELFAEELSWNSSMRQSVHNAITSGMPSLAECGGFMYLLDKLEDKEGKQYSMSHIVPGSSHNTGKLGRFGYITLTGSAGIIEGLSIRGHEFHYYDSSNNGSDALAVKPGSGRSWECVHAGDDHVWGFPHLYYPSCPELIIRFKKAMLEYKARKEI